MFLLHKMNITHSTLEINSLYHGPVCELGLLNKPDVAAAVWHVRFWAAPQMCFSLWVQCSRLLVYLHIPACCDSLRQVRPFDLSCCRCTVHPNTTPSGFPPMGVSLGVV